MNAKTIIGVLMLIFAVEVFINNWVYEIVEFWDGIDAAVIILLLIGAWQNLVAKS